MRTVDESFRDDYSRVLPVFKYGDPDVASSISGEMDIAIRKSSKMIAFHSIKAKPKTKKGKKLTAQQKEFFNKNEYNKWVDDGYLLVGKSHVYRQDYPNAIQTFNFIIREFPKEPAQYEAKIWLARTYSQTKEYNDAENIITTLASDKKFPKKFKLDLHTTTADFYIKQEKYLPAIKSLESALELVHRKKDKLRYMFILAQLYQLTKQPEKAAALYEKVIRKNPPYEMTFNAQINLAGSISSDPKNNREVRRKLQKMMRNNKNVDFLDQIYYALGNIELNEGNRQSAIENYIESVKYSTKNNDQKALTCLTLANMFYNDKDYVPAQAYYDSTLLYIDQDYPGIELIQSKAKSLNRLVENLNTISREDSLQRIAMLPEASRINIIDQIISDVRNDEAQAQMAESQRLQDYYNNQSRQNLVGVDKGSAKWYFYNPISIAQGMKDFQLRFGKRRLEDNWRRRNKSLNSGNEPDAMAMAEENQEKNKNKKTDNKSREFYLQNLPLTDSAMKVSKKRVVESYYNAGGVYHTDLNDIPQAIAIYEKMINRLPENEYVQSVYYQLYSMYKEINNESKAYYYRNLIITKYPESNFAKVMSDPEFYKQILEKEKEAERFYEVTYNAYNSGDYQQVIANEQVAQNRYKNNPVLPKFALLRAFAIGKTSDKMVFRNELNQLIANYPANEVSTQAKEIIVFMNTYQPETKQLEEIKVAEEIYVRGDSVNVYVALVIERSEDINQLVFDMINFNLDNFSNDKLELGNENLGKNLKIIAVKTFPNVAKALAYYKAISEKPEVLKNVKNPTKQLFVINQENYRTLLKQESADSYLQFFNLHFK